MIFQEMVQSCRTAFHERYPWFRSRSFYVADYRSYFEKVAEELSALRKVPVKARFNRVARCIELYTGAKTLAQVTGWGGAFFSPDYLTVRCDLSEGEKSLLADKVPIRLEFCPF